MIIPSQSNRFFAKSLYTTRLVMLVISLVSGCASGIERNLKSDTTVAKRLDKQVEILFEEAGVDGTFVLADSYEVLRHVYNSNRAQERFSPASTFKILNTLIALEAGAVDSVSSKFIWDGKKRWLESWNRDQTLASAFKISCVWCYQTLARSIGLDAYEKELRKIGFGNQSVGPLVGTSASTSVTTKADEFWLDGSLTISAFEQVEFLTALLNMELHYEQSQLDILKSIMYEASFNQGKIKLYGKTGWAAGTINVGWYVGFIESDDKTAIFALNMALDNIDKAPLRKQLVLESLKALNVLPAASD